MPATKSKTARTKWSTSILMQGPRAVAGNESRQPRVRGIIKAQCRKWRMPVKTMARPRRSAAAMTSASRTEPPGWITAVAPALAASSTPSGNGKKASEATTLPASEDCAFITAIFTESTRLIWPAPTPSVAPSLAKTMALDLTCLANFPGEEHGVHFFRRGGALGHGAQFALVDFAEVRLLHQHAAENAL